MNPNHAPEGINVEHRLDARERLEDGVQHADIGTDEENPGDRDQHPGNDDAGQGHHADKTRERRVGAVHHPGQEQSSGEGKQG